ncbi:MAG: FkbM family methyltransferase [Verrucomicrobiota bacterium]
MATAMKQLARQLLPRSARNALRSPLQTLHWWWNEQRAPLDLELRPGWRLKCPRNALDGAFRLQLHDPPQVRELDEFIALVKGIPSVSLLDIGSHFGVFSFAAAHYGGAKARALAVDPSALAGEMVRRIAGLNGCETRVQFHRAAVGASCGELAMVDTGVIGSGYMVLPGDQPESDFTRIPQTTIDELVKMMPAPPNVIKIDVESYEFEVLQGAVNTLAGASPILCLELHNRMMMERGVKPQAVVQWLWEHGYRRFFQGGREWSENEICGPEIARVLVRKG